MPIHLMKISMHVEKGSSKSQVVVAARTFTREAPHVARRHNPLVEAALFPREVIEFVGVDPAPLARGPRLLHFGGNDDRLRERPSP